MENRGQKHGLMAIMVICWLSGSLWGQNQLNIPPLLAGTNINLNLQNGSVQFFPGQSTQTFGANGDLLGPTLLLNQGDSVQINVSNDLGTPTTIHWHGLHVPAEADGGPHIVIPAGQTWSPSFRVLDWAGTYWYHPHLHMHTNEHVQKGIAGMIIVKDPIEAALNLPRTYGVDDFPLVVQTKAFDASNQIVVMSALDTAVMVNGTLRPELNVPAQMVRLRVLNGASERYLNLGLSANRSFQLIGTDGGLLEAPLTMTRLMLAPGERAEIVVDFQGLIGQNVTLMSYASELPNAIYGAGQPGMGPGQTIPGYSNNPLNGNNFNILSMVVVSPTAAPVNSLPSTLVNHQPWLAGQANTTRQLRFDPMNMGPTAIQGPFTINNQMFDLNVINYQVPFENIEIWELTNATPIGHPFHIHDVQFYILDINGAAPPAHLQGRKDVVHVPAGMGVVRFITRFEDYYDDQTPYMYHCHILTHEDDGMMGQFLVMPPCNNIITTQPTDQTASAGSTVQFSVSTNSLSATYQWQSDAGFGFQNLSNAGQYSGTNTPTLSVSALTLSNNNQLFRCIVSDGSCNFTSDTAKILLQTTAMDEDVNALSWVVFPNPSAGNFTVGRNGVGVETTEWMVHNLLGQTVWTAHSSDRQVVIPSEDWPRGTYFLKSSSNPATAIKLVKW